MNFLLPSLAKVSSDEITCESSVAQSFPDVGSDPRIKERPLGLHTLSGDNAKRSEASQTYVTGGLSLILLVGNLYLEEP